MDPAAGWADCLRAVTSEICSVAVCAHVLVCEWGSEYKQTERGCGAGALYVQVPSTIVLITQERATG